MSLGILFITTGLKLGGAERMLQSLLVRLSNRGYRVKVCSLGEGGRVGEELIRDGIDVEYIGFRKRIGDVVKLASLGRAIRQFDPDIVQTWMYHADLVGGVTAKLSSRAPVLWAVRQSDLDRRQSKRLTRWVVTLNVWLSRWVPSQVVYCAEYASRVHRDLGYRSTLGQVIHNGCDTEVFHQHKAGGQTIRRQLGLDDAVPVVGHAGRWDPQKDYPTLISAIRHISRSVPDAVFLLVGPDIDTSNSKLMQLIGTSGISNIYLMGASDCMADFYSALDCLVVSSAYGEGFPNVAAEAMACEVLCVATDVGDSAEILGNTGHIVPIRSPRKLADAALDVLAMESGQRARKGALARAHVTERFSLDRMVDTYERLYLNMARKGQH